MPEKVILATSDRGLTRAVLNGRQKWTVSLANQAHNFTGLAADPTTPGRVYAGSTNGVLVSTDKGETWAPCGMAGQIVKALAVSPHDSQVIYAGTKPALVYATRDGGQSWTELAAFRKIRGRWFWLSPAEPPDWRAYVQSLSISPTRPERIIAGIEFGAVVRSDDGGRTWSNHVTNTLRDCHDLKFHATNGDWVYEAGGSGGGAAFSRDGGVTWHKAKNGLAKHYGVSCAADPDRPEVWYVAVAPSPGKAYGKEAEVYLYRASGGADWQPIGWQEHPLPQMPMALVTDPAAPGHLYAGLSYGTVWHSTDYGDTWQEMPFNLGRVWRTMIIL